MSHLRLVPPLAPVECQCDHGYGRTWFQGAWHCTATDAVVRFYPTKGWHHYRGHRTINIPTEHEMEQAA